MKGFRYGRWLSVMLLSFISWSPLTVAESTNEIMSLGLEELLNLEISRREPLGIHHTHDAGETMINFSTGHMSMNGTSRQRTDALANFMVAPTSMDTEMVMLGAMYAPRNTVTLMAMVPYTKKSMDHVTRTGGQFTTESKGLGDIKLSGLVTVWRGVTAKIHVEFGATVPTGSIDAKDMTPAGSARLPYPMQLGSGTWDLLSGVTYQGFRNDISWGGHISAVTPTGRNDNDYRLGNRYKVTAWGSYLINDWMSSHIRLDGQRWQNISGADPALNANLVPTANPDLLGGRRIDLGIGVNGFVESGMFSGHRWSLEFRTPVRQNQNRYQLESNWSLHVGWSWTLAKSATLR